MSVQEQIEQLRAKVKRVNDFLDEIPEQYLTGGVPIYRHQLEQELAKLAALEAQAAAEADLWALAKKALQDLGKRNHVSDGARAILFYAEHLETENTRLESELAKTASTRDMAFNMLNDKNVQNAQLDGKINELEAELARRPVVLYAGNRAYTYETDTGQKS